MIQFNLLPDVKLAYVKATRTKHLVMLISFVVTGVSIGLVILLFVGVNILQREHMANLNKDIDSRSKKLQEEHDINKILTVQNQLLALNGSEGGDDGLHDTKPAAERLGPYLTQITPTEVTISQLAVDFTAGTMTIDGEAKSLKDVNEFVDTLKFTTYEEGSDGSEKTTGNAFNSVILESFSRQSGDNDSETSYQITLNFEPTIFSLTKSVKLVVPTQTTTRSVTERPEPLFQQSENHEEGGQ